MLQTRLSRVKVNPSEVKVCVNEISVTPLATPMICGPGALTYAIVIMEDATTIPMKIVLISAVMLFTYIILYSSSKIMKISGETNMNILMGLTGLIVMVIAV